MAVNGLKNGLKNGQKKGLKNQIQGEGTPGESEEHPGKGGEDTGRDGHEHQAWSIPVRWKGVEPDGF